MTDAHKSGARIACSGSKEGLFGIEGSTGTFEASLKDMPDVLGYMGLVVLKVIVNCMISIYLFTLVS